VIGDLFSLLTNRARVPKSSSQARANRVWDGTGRTDPRGRPPAAVCGQGGGRGPGHRARTPPPLRGWATLRINGRGVVVSLLPPSQSIGHQSTTPSQCKLIRLFFIRAHIGDESVCEPRHRVWHDPPLRSRRIRLPAGAPGPSVPAGLLGVPPPPDQAPARWLPAREGTDGGKAFRPHQKKNTQFYPQAGLKHMRHTIRSIRRQSKSPVRGTGPQCLPPPR